MAVEFRRTVNGTASSISIPNLKRLNFFDCRGINKFEISASKLEMLSVRGSVNNVVESRWLTPHLKAIKALWLCGSSLLYIDASLFATAINLQVLGCMNYILVVGSSSLLLCNCFKNAPTYVNWELRLIRK
ncbi:uncharacterized protein LOC116025413 [Ipomoea triloba]|uniref:uncharacterized protein LOC116025413 n=1 Tax=Ipomoea triloba TaxID=35885 RepID=UPI00125D55C5|nr:uncharacterized protein LOC116025413 [Ipomoea triloba]